MSRQAIGWGHWSLSNRQIVNESVITFPGLLGRLNGLGHGFHFPTLGKVVSIDLGKHSIKAAVVRKQGDGAVISSCAEIDRTHDDIYQDLADMLERVKIGSGRAIIVTDQVRFLASELSIPPDKKLPEDKLLSAVAWEMEPYLDFPPAEGLLTYQLQAHETGGDTTPVLISAVDRGTYARFSEILKGQRLTLYRAYSPEGAFASASRLPGKDKSKIVIDCRQDSIRSVFLLTTGPFVFQNLPGDVRDIEESLREITRDMTAAAGRADEIVIAGDGISDDVVHDLKPEFGNVRPWTLEDGPVRVELGPGILDFGPRYATAMGAALQELKVGTLVPFGVTDRVSLIKSITKRVKKDKLILPAAMLTLFFVAVTVHFVTIKVSISRCTSEIKVLNEEKKRLLIPIEKKKDLLDKIKKVNEKIDYLEETLCIGQKNLLTVLYGISSLRPNDMVLTEISQNEDGSFTIEGNALQGRSVAYFSNKLSALKFCKKATISTMNNEGISEGVLFPYHFIIDIKI